MTLAHICRGRRATLPSATRGRLLHLGLVLAVSLLATPAAGQGAAEAVATEGRAHLELHKGRVIRLPRPAATVFVADPEIADVQAHSPCIVYLLASAPGDQPVCGRRARPGPAAHATWSSSTTSPGLRPVHPAAPADAAGSSSPRSTAASCSAAWPTARAPAQEVREPPSPLSRRQDEALVNRLPSTADPGHLRVRVAEVSRDVSQAVRLQLGVACSARATSPSASSTVGRSPTPPAPPCAE